MIQKYTYHEKFVKHNQKFLVRTKIYAGSIARAKNKKSITPTFFTVTHMGTKLIYIVVCS